MKGVVIILGVLFCVLQYKLWLTDGGVLANRQLHSQIAVQYAKNQHLAEQNKLLRVEIEDLKHGYDAIEDYARSDLGMIRRGEVFYQFVK